MGSVVSSIIALACCGWYYDNVTPLTFNDSTNTIGAALAGVYYAHYLHSISDPKDRLSTAVYGSVGAISSGVATHLISRIIPNEYKLYVSIAHFGASFMLQRYWFNSTTDDMSGKIGDKDISKGTNES